MGGLALGVDLILSLIGLGLVEFINKFFGGLGLRIGKFEFEFSLFRAQHDRLAFHAPHHIKRSPRSATQGHFQKVVFNARLDRLAQLRLDLKEAIGRTKAINALIGPFVIVVLDPELDALARVLEGIELRAHQKVLPDRGPEALDLAQGHGMLRAAFEVLDPVLAQLRFEARGAPPGGVLYCRPLSVSISLGGLNSPTPTRYT